MINNYNQEKLNYEILYNINNLTKDNVINDINYIIIIILSCFLHLYYYY